MCACGNRVRAPTISRKSWNHRKSGKTETNLNGHEKSHDMLILSKKVKTTNECFMQCVNKRKRGGILKVLNKDAMKTFAKTSIQIAIAACKSIMNER